MLRSPCTAIRLGVKIVSGASEAGSCGASSLAGDERRANLATNTVISPHGDVMVDQIPSTIPGVSREELAERLKKMEMYLRQQTLDAHQKNLAKRIDTMRRAMPPDQFKEFLARIEEAEARSMEEAEKMSHMTPLELYRYQEKMRRRENIKQWLNLLLLLTLFLLGVYLMFFFLVFFFY